MKPEFYSVPFFVHGLKLRGSELMVYIVLRMLRAKSGSESFFFVTNKEIAQYSRISLRTVKRARQTLKYRRLIDYILKYPGAEGRTKIWFIDKP